MYMACLHFDLVYYGIKQTQVVILIPFITNITSLYIKTDGKNLELQHFQASYPMSKNSIHIR